MRELLSNEVQDFIKEHTGTDIHSLALRKNPFPGIDWNLILQQISGRAKAKAKLPTWFEQENILYPGRISMEQTSSETTAGYKAQVVSGKSLADLSGGFGVDAYFFARNMEMVVHCEQNEDLSEIAAHNFQQLNATNIECYNGDSLTILKTLNRKFDWIFVDPARRHESKGKVFKLSECEPNVPDLLPEYFRFGNNILIKTSPLLDLSAGIAELEKVHCIHVVAVENEVKELLWVLNEEITDVVTIETVNFTKAGRQTFSFKKDQPCKPTFSLPGRFIYEPNAALMKAGAFDVVSEAFGLHKLQKHAHLYTADVIKEFPGRRFEVMGVFPYGKKQIKELLEGKKINITLRNFPDTVEAIRKKWKIRDGGDQYCFLTTNMRDERIMIICNKI